jgi:uncharacterized membrane protein
MQRKSVDMSSWRTKLAEALLLLVAVAVVARVVWDLLGPLLPVFGTLLVVILVVAFVLRGPRSGGKPFHS